MIQCFSLVQLERKERQNDALKSDSQFMMSAKLESKK